MKRKFANLQKSSENERQANKENLEPTSPDCSSAAVPNNFPNVHPIVQCLENLMSEKSPTISFMDTTEMKTTIIGTSVLDNYLQEGFLADAGSSKKYQEEFTDFTSQC